MTEYINEKVKNAFLNFIKKIAFEEGGIFYGAIVRDEYISEHYKKIYNNQYTKHETILAYLLDCQSSIPIIFQRNDLLKVLRGWSFFLKNH